VARIVEEIAIVAPKIIVVMGEEALATLGEVDIPLARSPEPCMGAIQQFTHSIEVLYVPDVDDSLDEQDSKREFWAAFRVLGEWYAQQPPY
jgi:uracil-DNA glycosylase